MGKKIHCFLISLLGLLLSAGISNAALMATPGLNNATPTENVTLTLGEIGNPIFGDIDGIIDGVKFTGNENLEALASGQAKISGTDTTIDFIDFELADQSGFDRVKFFIDSEYTGTFDLRLFSTLGGFTSIPLAISENGLQSYTGWSSDPSSELINRVQISSSVTDGFNFIQQFRIGLQDPQPVPEPATMLLFGSGIVGLAANRLRRRKKL